MLQPFKIAERIFQHYQIAEVVSVAKIDIGFSNDLYVINDAYILKLSKSEEDKENLEREIYFCNLFQTHLPAPMIIASDTAKTLIDRYFIVYQKICGDNLYATWHLYTNEQRKEVVRQICTLLRTINTMPVDASAQQFDPASAFTWHDRICTSITQTLDILEQSKILAMALTMTTRKFLAQHHHLLHKQHIALTYFDPHFDNFLVRNGEIVGMLGFERTGLMSIDYVLDLVRRMVEFPRKYVSAQYSPFIQDGDYAHLLTWYREFYPELFAFPGLETRLNLYSVEHTLRDMFYFPEDKELPRILAQYLGRELHE